MKKITGLIIFLLCTVISYAQFPNNQAQNPSVSNSSTIYVVPVLKSKLAFMLPIVDTLNNAATFYPGSMTMRPQDTVGYGSPRVYISNGRYWSLISNGGGGGGSGIDSITSPDNNLCFWSAGLATCYPLGRYYDSTTLNHDSTYYKHWNNGNFIDSIWIPHDNVYGDGRIVITAHPSVLNPLKDSIVISWDSTGFSSGVDSIYVTVDSQFVVKYSDGHLDTIPFVGTGGSSSDGSGITELGTGYGLTNVNDSTYNVDSSVIATRERLVNELGLKLNISDTASMLSSYQTAINTNTTNIALKLNISDTAAMLSPYKTSYPREAISLTTTGSSGAATYNNGTGVLNVPQYSGGGGSGITKAYAPLIVNAAGDSISQRFNVFKYGATGDSAQDATAAIQAAIDACIAAGGGDVFFPNGIYTLGGALVTSENGVNPNSQLYIPPVYVAPARTHIRFIGETGPNYTPAALYVDTTFTRKGVILRSTITGSGILPSVFGGKGDVTSGSAFTFHYVNFENITLIVKSNAGGTGPTMSGINGSQYASLQVDNCIVGIDTSLFRAALPQNEVAGIITTKGTGETRSGVRRSLTYGFRYGIVAGEHCMLENAQAFGCYASFVMNGHPFSGHPVYASKILSQWSTYDILVPNTTTDVLIAGTANFKIDLLEVETYNTDTRWFNNVKTIADSGNRGSSILYYKVINSTGVTGSLVFSQYNGTGIYSIPLSTPGLLPYPLTLYRSGDPTKYLQLRKGDGTGSAYKNLGVNDAIVANRDDIGNLSFLNDFTTGNINFATGGSSTPQMTLDADGKLNLATTAVDGLSLVSTTVGRGGMYLRNTPAGQSTTLYLDNDRGAFANYTGMFIGGSAKGGAALGLNMADRAFLIADGANNLGLVIGTLASQPLSFGTNNLERLRIGSAGDWLLAGTTAGTSGYVLTSNGAGTPPTWQVTGSPWTVTGSDLYRNSKVMIGSTTAPTAPFHIKATSVSAWGQSSIQSDAQTGNAAIIYETYYDQVGTRLMVMGLGHYAGGTDPNYYFANEIASGGIIFRNSSADIFTIANSGATRMHNYGAGTATFDASGNITSVSDERLKNIQGYYKSGLKELMKINPITYKWNKKSGNEMDSTYAGFSAQNVKENIPYGTGVSKDGYLSLQDRAILAVAINAIKEQQKEIEYLKAELKKLSNRK